MAEGYHGERLDIARMLSNETRNRLEELAKQTMESTENTIAVSPDDIITKIIESGQELSDEHRTYLRSYLGETLPPKD